MTDPVRSDPATILSVVIALLDERGYDGWQLSDVAKRARASLATIYKHFPSREELIVAALERWMEEHAYRPIPKPSPDDSPIAALRIALHNIFEPWEQYPSMLQVFVRACSTTGRARIRAQGNAALEPLGILFEDQLDPEFANDLALILSNVVEGALNRYLNGDIPISDILVSLDRTLYRLEQASSVDPPGRDQLEAKAVSSRPLAANHRGRLPKTAGRS